MAAETRIWGAAGRDAGSTLISRQTVLEMDLVQIPKSAYGASQSMWHACPSMHLRAAR